MLTQELATAAKSSPIATGVLLGVSGCHPPYNSAEHIVLHSSGLTPLHPEDVRITAYRHLHPHVSHQYYATPNFGRPQEPQISFTEC